MKRILVSVLSKYLQPNFLFIKEMEGQYDRLVFITTAKMEDETNQSTRYLTEALGIKEKDANPIKISDDDSLSAKNTLEAQQFSQDDEYLVNLTGGTKVMSIATKDFFEGFKNVNFYYIPEGKNEIRKLYSTEEARKITYRINLKEYFTLNRLYFKCRDKFYHSEQFSLGVFAKFREAGYIANRVYEIRNAHILDSSEDRTYYSGAWFEEYMYYRLKRQYSLTEEYICTGAKIYHRKEDLDNLTNNDNEIDIMFVYNNKLYLFECKISLTKMKGDEKENSEKYLYKLAAISKFYGLVINSYLATLYRYDTLAKGVPEGIEKRKNILGIKGVLFSKDIEKDVIKL